MRIPYRWLTEFVETDASAAQAAERLVMAGLEVASVTEVAPGLRDVVIGEVLEVQPHPAGGPLTLCVVDGGRGRHRVACGAPGVRPGLRAAFAPPGAVLPGGRRIEAAVVRGTASEGMLCSAAEVGAGEEAGALLTLDADAPVGTDLARWLGLDDVLLEVEITPNRPDCLSVAGVAREVAALTGGRFRPPVPALAEGEEDAITLARVSVEDAELCPRYAARVITGVTVGPSPARVAQRLRLVGLRPINNAVDVTNYVLWELGHPLHAFDRDRVVDRHVVVRRARAGEVLVTLDGQSRTLGPEMLVIADPDRAIGIAGVMGGANTEVADRTDVVLLESAYFHPGSIRRTARALGLSTEASYRFERGADIEGLRLALDRAAGQIAALGGGRVARGVLDAYPAPRPLRRITVRPARIRQVIGAAPPAEEVAGILGRLGFPVAPRGEAPGEALDVEVPSFRRDVTLEDDLVEEVIRVWGYDRIPSTLPSGTLALTRRPRSLEALGAVRRALTAAGYQEAVTLAMVDPERLPLVGLARDEPRVVALKNPLAADRSVLRPTLLLGLLEAAATNVRRQAADVRLFEVGRVFEGQGPGRQPREETRVAFILTGLGAPRSWFAGGGRADVFDVKGAVESVVEALGRGPVTVEPLPAAHLEEGRGARVRVGEVEVGAFGELAPAVQAAFGLSSPVYVAELSIDGLETLSGRPLQHRALPRFPGVQRDLAVVLPAEVPAADVERAIRAAASAALRRVVLFDVYTGDPVPAGRKSLAFGLFYQADERTLTDQEVNAMHTEVVEHVRARLGAEVRGDGPRGPS